jgi:hypothetical protein
LKHDTNTIRECDDAALCPAAAAAGRVGALLVVPAALAGQVMDEISLHSDLTVLHYTGVAQHSTPQ